MEHWVSAVLSGRNVASYEFARAKSLLDLGDDGQCQALRYSSVER